MADLKDKFVFQLITGASQVLVPLLVYPYVTRVLGPQQLGIVNYIDFLSQMFIIFAAFGIPFYAIREVATVRNNPEARSVLIQELLSLHFLFTLAALLFFVLFTYNRWQDHGMLYLLAAGNIFISIFTLDWYMQGMELFGYSAIRYLVVRLLLIAGFFLLVHSSQDVTAYLAIYSFGYLAMAFVHARKMWLDNIWIRKPLQLKRHMRPLWHFFLTSSAISLYIYFDTVLLERITGSPVLVGYYTTAVKLVKVFLVALLALGTVLLPRLSYLVNEGKLEEATRHLQTNLDFIWVVGLPVSAGIFLLAPEAMFLIAGNEFAQAAPLLQIMALIPLVIALSNLFCFQTLVPFKMERRFLLVVATGSVLSILLNMLLIPYWGAAGSAWANLITETYIAGLSAYFAGRLIRFQIPQRMYLSTLFCCLLFWPLIEGFRMLVSSPLLLFMIAVSSCMLLYYFLQRFVFRNPVLLLIEDYFVKLSGRFRLR